MPTNEEVELAVVVRYTRYDSQNPANQVALMAGFRNPVEADREAARLNAVSRDPAVVTYFVKILRLRVGIAEEGNASTR